MKTAVKDAGILSKESEVKTLEFDFCMLDCSFQVFAIIFTCLHCAILFQYHSMGKELWFYLKKGQNMLYILTANLTLHCKYLAGKKNLLISVQV